MTAEFNYQLRVYYDATDAAGLVYHANYLKFMEQARTEWLRHLGFTHHQLKQHYQLTFVVRTCTIDYVKPAFLDDVLSVTVEVVLLKRASLIVSQKILRWAECLNFATVKLACVHVVSLRPQPFPTEIFKAFADASSTA